MRALTTRGASHRNEFIRIYLLLLLLWRSLLLFVVGFFLVLLLCSFRAHICGYDCEWMRWPSLSWREFILFNSIDIFHKRKQTPNDGENVAQATQTKEFRGQLRLTALVYSLCVYNKPWNCSQTRTTRKIAERRKCRTSFSNVIQFSLLISFSGTFRKSFGFGKPRVLGSITKLSA